MTFGGMMHITKKLLKMALLGQFLCVSRKFAMIGLGQEDEIEEIALQPDLYTNTKVWLIHNVKMATPEIVGKFWRSISIKINYAFL